MLAADSRLTTALVPVESVVLATSVRRFTLVAAPALTGTRQMDASAILEYFQPLQQWLTEQNKGQVCGW